MSEPVKREPAADIRQAASSMREIYVALVDEGFTEHQALIIVGNLAAGAAGRPPA